MLRRTLRRRGGLSNVLSTIILSSVLLSIMIAATYLANDVLNIQIAATEFKSTEILMTTIDSEVNKLTFKPGSSATISTSFSTTAPGYTKTGENLNIIIEDSTQRAEYSAEITLFNIEGRQQITGAPDYYLQGNSYYILNSTYEVPYGCIHVYKPSKMRTSLDYGRALYTVTGPTKFFNSSSQDEDPYDFYNTLELTFVNLTFGRFEAGSNSMILMKNEGVESETFILDSDWTITVSRPDIPTRAIDLDEVGGNSEYKTRVIFHRIQIEISVLGGG